MEKRIEQETIIRLTAAINGDVPYEAFVQIVQKDKHFSNSSKEEIDRFLLAFLRELNRGEAGYGGD